MPKTKANPDGKVFRVQHPLNRQPPNRGNSLTQRFNKIYMNDPAGNRDTVVNGGTTSYSHNELNEYTAVGAANYTSDLRGNLTSDGTYTYSYDLENRLTAVSGGISYKYDPFGKRIEKNVSSSVTKYIHSGDQIIEEWEGETLARKYIYGAGIDEPLVMITSGGSKYYYHFDALGSVRNLTNSSGSTVATYKYNVYGAFSLSGTSYGNSYTFTGRQWDSESGLYYYRARYYSPTIGRFLQTDPAGYQDGPNLYTYATNNPVDKVDPEGKGCELSSTRTEIRWTAQRVSVQPTSNWELIGCWADNLIFNVVDCYYRRTANRIRVYEDYREVEISYYTCCES